MPRQWGVSLHMGLSQSHVALAKVRGMWRPRLEVQADQALPEHSVNVPDNVVATVSSLLAANGCRKLKTFITLSDEWERMWTVTPPRNAASLADCKAAAHARFFTLYGEPPTDWHIRADWKSSQQFIACAMANTAYAAIKSIVADNQLSLVQLAPGFVVAWNRWRSHLFAQAWFAQLVGQRLTVGVVDKFDLLAVRSTPVPPDGLVHKQWLQDYVAREALRLGVPQPKQLQLCGVAPSAWFLRDAGGLVCTALNAPQAQGLSSTPAGLLLAHRGLWV